VSVSVSIRVRDTGSGGRTPTDTNMKYRRVFEKVAVTVNVYEHMYAGMSVAVSII